MSTWPRRWRAGVLVFALACAWGAALVGCVAQEAVGPLQGGMTAELLVRLKQAVQCRVADHDLRIGVHNACGHHWRDQWVQPRELSLGTSVGPLAQPYDTRQRRAQHRRDSAPAPQRRIRACRLCCDHARRNGLHRLSRNHLGRLWFQGQALLQLGQKRQIIAPGGEFGAAQHVANHLVGVPGLRLARACAQPVQGLGKFICRQLAIHQCRNRLVGCTTISFHLLVPHQRFPDCRSSKGLTLAEMASRARNIRERTVPIGQSMASAISS